METENNPPPFDFARDTFAYDNELLCEYQFDAVTGGATAAAAVAGAGGDHLWPGSHRAGVPSAYRPPEREFERPQPISTQPRDHVIMGSGFRRDGPPSPRSVSPARPSPVAEPPRVVHRWEAHSRELGALSGNGAQPPAARGGPGEVLFPRRHHTHTGPATILFSFDGRRLGGTPKQRAYVEEALNEKWWHF